MRTPETETPRLFHLGRLHATPGALKKCEELNVSLNTLLHRHATGDWGDMCAEDKSLNNGAVTDGSRIFSAYQISPTDKIWVITESDRSITTFLLPDEY